MINIYTNVNGIQINHTSCCIIVFGWKLNCLYKYWYLYLYYNKIIRNHVHLFKIIFIIWIYFFKYLFSQSVGVTDKQTDRMPNCQVVTKEHVFLFTWINHFNDTFISNVTNVLIYLLWKMKDKKDKFKRNAQKKINRKAFTKRKCLNVCFALSNNTIFVSEIRKFIYTYVYLLAK